MVLTNIHRTFHEKATEYMFFSSAHGTFSRTDHVLDHKTNFKNFRNTETVSCIIYNHSSVKVDINCMKKTENFTNIGH